MLCDESMMAVSQRIYGVPIVCMESLSQLFIHNSKKKRLALCPCNRTNSSGLILQQDREKQFV